MNRIMGRIGVAIVVGLFASWPQAASAWSIHGAVWQGVKAAGTHCPAIEAAKAVEKGAKAAGKAAIAVAKHL